MTAAGRRSSSFPDALAAVEPKRTVTIASASKAGTPRSLCSIRVVRLHAQGRAATSGDFDRLTAG